MKTLKSFLAGVFFLGFLGCANLKAYSLPLTPKEGLLMAPALVAASQAASLEAWKTQEGGAVAVLEDGTRLSWQTSSDRRDFLLLVYLPGDTQESKRTAAFETAKNRADAIWQAALQIRAGMMPRSPVTLLAPPVTQ